MDQVAVPAAMLDYRWHDCGELTRATWLSARECPLVAVRIAGATLLAPVMEEPFRRNFLMRWNQTPVFEGAAPQRVGLKAIVLSTFLFMLAHPLWLAATVAGLACAWLYIRSGRLWAPMAAHAAINGMLAVWVVATVNWQFW